MEQRASEEGTELGYRRVCLRATTRTLRNPKRTPKDLQQGHETTRRGPQEALEEPQKTTQKEHPQIIPKYCTKRVSKTPNKGSFPSSLRITKQSQKNGNPFI